MTTIGILHYSGPPVVGGVEQTIYQHARLLADGGNRVRVVAGSGAVFDSRVEFVPVPEAGPGHPDVLAVEDELRQGVVSEGFERLRALLRGAVGTAFAPAEVCIAHDVLSTDRNLALTAAVHDLAIAGDIRVIGWCHHLAPHDPSYARMLHPGYPWDLLSRPWPGVRYVTVSHLRRTDLARLFSVPPAEIAVVNPGVDPASFAKLEPATHALATRLGLFRADPLLLLPVPLTPRKNVELALRILAALLRHAPDAVLVVTAGPDANFAGGAQYLARLRQLRTELGIEGHVHFLYELAGEGQSPDISDAIVSDLYRLADALLLTSLDEGFGIPVLEAALARLPAFSTDVPAVRAISNSAARLFFQDEAPAQVAWRIFSTLASNEQYELSRRVKRQFTWQGIVDEQLRPLIDEVSRPK